MRGFGSHPGDRQTSQAKSTIRSSRKSGHPSRQRFKRDEAKPNSVFKQRYLPTRVRDLAARCARVVHEIFRPTEGVGNAGCPMHPRSRVHVVVVERTRVTTSTPESPGIPARNGFNGFLRALPGDRALLPPSPCGLKVLSDPVEPNEPPQDLTPASRRQDHTTSPSASSAVVLHAANRSRRAIRPALRFARLTLLRPPHLIPRS